MRKLKLASLALVMFISAVGAYANSRAFQDMYYIIPFTSPMSTEYEVASGPPAEGCLGTGDFVCVVIATSGYNPGQKIPAGDATIYTKYY